METNAHSKNSAELVTSTLSRGCVFLSNPFPECYCMNITIYRISKMLKYCTGDFKLCVIYSDKNDEKTNNKY